MSDPFFDQLAGESGPVDPGRAFRERLWHCVEVELDGPTVEAAVAPAVEQEGSARRVHLHGVGALAWLRASRTRTVPVAAAAVAVFSLGLGVALRSGDDPDAEQTVEVVDAPSPTARSEDPLPELGPPAVVDTSPGIRLRSPSPPPRSGATARPLPVVPGSAAKPPGRRGQSWAVWYGASVGGVSGIYSAVAGVAGSQRRVVGGGSYNAQPVLSPDRLSLAWTRGMESHDVRSIWMAGVGGANVRELPLPKCAVYAVCEYRWPTFSGDGGRMAFMRGTANSGCTPAEKCNEIVVHDIRAGSVTAVGYGDSPEWSPRRGEIAYSGTAGPAMRQPCEAVNCVDSEIRVVDVSGAGAPSRRIGSVLGYAPRFSPDGEWIAYSSQGSTAVIVRRDGTEERDVPGCTQPNWAPDGRLACLMRIDGGDDIYLLDADDQPDKRLTFTPAVFEAQFRIYAL